MARTRGLQVDGIAVDAAAQPQWARTGYMFFPYAANHFGQWWVLRLNHGFPEHEMYTVFVDGRPAAEPVLDAETAAAVVKGVFGLRLLRQRARRPVHLLLQGLRPDGAHLDG